MIGSKNDEKEEGKAYIIEHLENICNNYIGGSIDEIVTHLYNVANGLEKDRFYGNLGKHIYEVTSFNRKPLNSDSIDDFLSK